MVLLRRGRRLRLGLGRTEQVHRRGAGGSAGRGTGPGSGCTGTGCPPCPSWNPHGRRIRRSPSRIHIFFFILPGDPPHAGHVVLAHDADPRGTEELVRDPEDLAAGAPGKWESAHLAGLLPRPRRPVEAPPLRGREASLRRRPGQSQDSRIAEPTAVFQVGPRRGNTLSGFSSRMRRWASAGIGRARNASRFARMSLTPGPGPVGPKKDLFRKSRQRREVVEQARGRDPAHLEPDVGKAARQEDRRLHPDRSTSVREDDRKLGEIEGDVLDHHRIGVPVAGPWKDAGAGMEDHR